MKERKITLFWVSGHKLRNITKEAKTRGSFIFKWRGKCYEGQRESKRNSEGNLQFVFNRKSMKGDQD